MRRPKEFQVRFDNEVALHLEFERRLAEDTRQARLLENVLDYERVVTRPGACGQMYAVSRQFLRDMGKP